MSDVPGEDRLTEKVLRNAIEDLKNNPYPDVLDSRKYYALQRENESLRGHVRRLEKSNQELGEELQRCKNEYKQAKGWD